MWAYAVAWSRKLDQLKGRSLRGAFAKLCGQGINSVLRLGFVIVMAHLLEPADFGLVAMVTIVTGIYELFATAGLSAATVQRATIGDREISTLFWINLLVGVVLGLLCLLTGPVLVAFYHEPRLLAVTAALATGFLVNAAGVQHLALLQRELRYLALAVIETLALLASIAVGVGMALAGMGYWSLVASALVQSACSTIMMWLATSWIPGRPERLSSAVVSMLHFGATITLTNLVVHIGYNFDKLLIGRVMGTEALGIYGRAYQLINIPNTTLLSAVGGVAFSALSRLQDDQMRCKAYFLKGYALVNSLTLPTTMFCAVFADEIILICLGDRWGEAIPIFRLLAPTIMVFGIINPTGWFLQSMGLHGRALKMAWAIAPLVIAACAMGLPYGTFGVALAISLAMTLWVVPHILWTVRGTVLSAADLFKAIWKPFLASCAAGFVGFEFISHFSSLSLLSQLLLGSCAFGATYAVVLLFVLGQKRFFLDVLGALRRASTAPAAAVASADQGG